MQIEIEKMTEDQCKDYIRDYKKKDPAKIYANDYTLETLVLVVAHLSELQVTRIFEYNTLWNNYTGKK